MFFFFTTEQLEHLRIVVALLRGPTSGNLLTSRPSVVCTFVTFTFSAFNRRLYAITTFEQLKLSGW